jgi:hypothetical protein
MLTFDDFSGSIGKDFEVAVGEGAQALRLSSADELPHGIRDGGSFRLEFSGPVSPILPQAIYAMREGGRDLEIFIVPISAGAAGARYEAIFN